MSVKYCLPVPVFYFWRKLERTLQRGLSAIAELLVFFHSALPPYTHVTELLLLLLVDRQTFGEPRPLVVQ